MDNIQDIHARGKMVNVEVDLLGYKILNLPVTDQFSVFHGCLNLLVAEMYREM